MESEFEELHKSLDETTGPIPWKDLKGIAINIGGGNYFNRMEFKLDEEYGIFLHRIAGMRLGIEYIQYIEEKKMRVLNPLPYVRREALKKLRRFLEKSRGYHKAPKVHQYKANVVKPKKLRNGEKSILILEQVDKVVGKFMSGARIKAHKDIYLPLKKQDVNITRSFICKTLSSIPVMKKVRSEFNTFVTNREEWDKWKKNVNR